MTGRRLFGRGHQVADVGEMLERGVGVAVALEHDEARSLSGGQAGTAISLSSACKIAARSYAAGTASTGSSPERAGVFGPDDVHRLLRQPLPFLQLAGGGI